MTKHCPAYPISIDSEQLFTDIMDFVSRTNAYILNTPERPQDCGQAHVFNNLQTAKSISNPAGTPCSPCRLSHVCSGNVAGGVETA